MKKKTVIIIGAGAAGLIAALELSAHCEVVILEAAERLGGRIFSIPVPGSPYPIEGGAEFVHGVLPITLALLKKAGIEYLPIDGKMYRKENKQWVEQTGMIEGWQALVKKMKGLDTDMTMTDFLHKYYPDDQYADLRRYVIAYVEGFDVADPDKVSVKALYDEWSGEEEENFRIPGGYQQLVNWLEESCLEKGCNILTSETVRQIDWQEEDVTIYTETGKKYYADKVVITAPLSVMGKISGRAAINITPPVDTYIQAMNNIGSGAVIKICLHFHHILWEEDTRFIFSDESIPTWWTLSPLKTNTLIGWVGGPKATSMAGRTDESLLETAIQSLANIFDVTAAEIRNNIAYSRVFNWLNVPEANGAYSYPTPETEASRTILLTPLGKSVFFAGEGVYTGSYPGTVEAALFTGKETAKKIIRML